MNENLWGAFGQYDPISIMRIVQVLLGAMRLTLLAEASGTIINTEMHRPCVGIGGGDSFGKASCHVSRRDTEAMVETSV